MTIFSACSRPLGMENRAIRDAQITASSQFNANHGPSNGRLNFKAGGGKTGAWSARTNDVNQYLQVDFGHRTKVTEIETQGREDCCNQWVKSYTVSYSNDNNNYKPYRDANGQAKVRSELSQEIAHLIVESYFFHSSFSCNEKLIFNISRYFWETPTRDPSSLMWCRVPLLLAIFASTQELGTATSP